MGGFRHSSNGSDDSVGGCGERMGWGLMNAKRHGGGGSQPGGFVMGCGIEEEGMERMERKDSN